MKLFIGDDFKEELQKDHKFFNINKDSFNFEDTSIEKITLESGKKAEKLFSKFFFSLEKNGLLEILSDFNDLVNSFVMKYLQINLPEF